VIAVPAFLGWSWIFNPVRFHTRPRPQHATPMFVLAQGPETNLTITDLRHY
jgi:hypothetical protein